MSSHPLTINIPPLLYEWLQRRAIQTGRSINDEVIIALSETASDEDKALQDVGTFLDSLPALDDDTLRRLAEGRMTAKGQLRLAELADQRQREGLSADELQEAEGLAMQQDRIILIRAWAAAMLVERAKA